MIHSVPILAYQFDRQYNKYLIGYSQSKCACAFKDEHLNFKSYTVMAWQTIHKIYYFLILHDIHIIYLGTVLENTKHDLI